MSYNNRQQYQSVRQPYVSAGNTPECCCNTSTASRTVSAAESGCCRAVDPLAGLPLASSYTPWQQYENIYSEDQALCHGTIFIDLYLPFTGRRP